MKLNHENYQRAFLPVELDERTGRDLLNQAGKAAKPVYQKFCARAVAIISCIVIAGGAGAGISYAQTGMGPIKLFSVMFQSHSQSAALQMENGFVVSGETIASGNVQVTLNNYFYDENHQIVLSEITVSTVDQTDLYSEEEVLENMNEDLEELTQEEFNRDYESTIISMFESEYSSICLDIDSEGPVHTEMENGHVFHQYSVIRGKKYADGKIESLTCMWQGHSIGAFFIENSGDMRFRSLDVLDIADCQNAEICGAYLNVIMNRISTEEINPFGVESYIPFNKMEITMSDGHIYRWEKEDPEWSGTEKDHILTPEEEAYWEEENGVTKIFGEVTVVENFDTELREITIDLPDFVNIDDIVSVTFDGMEVLSDQ